MWPPKPHRLWHKQSSPTCTHLQGASRRGTPKRLTRRPSTEAEGRPNSLSNPSASLSPIQIDAFSDERMKILYTLSFMHGGMAQVWAANETSTFLANTSTFNTLEGLLALVERTFGNPDKERTARTQFHALRMTPGMTAEEYMAN